MAWLLDGEKILMICLFVLTQLTNVTDRQTDTHRDRRTPHDGIGRAYNDNDDNDEFNERRTNAIKKL